MEIGLIIFWLGVNTLIGFTIGQKKNEVGGCIALSIFLGPIGWIVAATMGGNVRKCPFCAENCKPEALVCPHCQRDIPKIEAPKPAPAAAPPKLKPLPPRSEEDEKTKGMRALAICIAVVLVLVVATFIVITAADRPPSAKVDGSAQGKTEMPAEEYVATPAPPQFVRLTSDFTLVDPKGREVKTLDPGKRLRVVERFQHDVTVDYLGEHYSIPTAITEPSQ
jgi:hypothetical protein